MYAKTQDSPIEELYDDNCTSKTGFEVGYNPRKSWRNVNTRDQDDRKTVEDETLNSGREYIYTICKGTPTC